MATTQEQYQTVIKAQKNLTYPIIRMHEMINKSHHFRATYEFDKDRLQVAHFDFTVAARMRSRRFGPK